MNKASDEIKHLTHNTDIAKKSMKYCTKQVQNACHRTQMIHLLHVDEETMFNKIWCRNSLLYSADFMYHDSNFILTS